MTKRAGWDIQRTGSCVQVARKGRTRLDFSAATFLQTHGRLRVAQEVRQDLWRCLQGQRGFTPIVRTEQESNGMLVTAGGMVDGIANLQSLTQRVANLLADPTKRARWGRYV